MTIQPTAPQSAPFTHPWQGKKDEEGFWGWGGEGRSKDLFNHWQKGN